MLTYVRRKTPNTGRRIDSFWASRKIKSPYIIFGACFSTWNASSISRKLWEISETLKRSCTDVCCLKDVR